VVDSNGREGEQEVATIPMSAKKAACLASAVVIPLSLVQYWLERHLSGHDLVFSIVFYILFPGDVVWLLITGVHGRTRMEEAVAPFVGAATNVILYSLLLYGASRLRRVFNRQPKSISS
jgi:hypothetical protein